MASNLEIMLIAVKQQLEFMNGLYREKVQRDGESIALDEYIDAYNALVDYNELMRSTDDRIDPSVVLILACFDLHNMLIDIEANGYKFTLEGGVAWRIEKRQ